MQIGGHVASKDPFGLATEIGADVVQIHLSAPRVWRGPKERKDAEEIKTSKRIVSAHAPYLCNPASGDPAVREKTAVNLQQTLDEAERCGIGGVVVHAGHAAGGGTMRDAIDRWVELASGLRSTVPLLIENTATGDTAPGRHLADIVELFSALRGADLDVPLGTCFDTCHAWAGDPECAADPAGYVKAYAEATDGIALLHINDSKDAPGAGRDRHENLGAGSIGLDALEAMICTAAELGTAAGVVETPNGGEAHAADIEAVRRMLA